MKKTAAIIVNPVAGKKRIQSELFSLILSLRNQDYESVVYITKSRGDATEAAEKYGKICELIVCCGGDGTLNEVIKGLLKIEIRPLLLYYPCGSTNDFASTLGLTQKVEDAICNIDSREILELDVGMLNENYNFSYITSFGIFTKASFSAKQSVKNIIGHLAYVLEGAKELNTLSKSYYARITHDNGIIEGDYALVAVTNSTSAGGVLKLPSDIVRLNDGLFEILLIKRLKNATDISKVISMLLKQKYDGESIIMIQTKNAVIECDDSPCWCTDGECAGNISRAEVKCLNKAIRIVI